MDALDEALAARVNANTADLAEFKSHGGKLVLWHGFADPRVPTLNTVAYYERLIARQSPGEAQQKGERKEALRRTQEFARLFLAPGVAHCGGGAGADTFDPILTVEQWVETGVAPDQIIASKVVSGATTFTRPLCPIRRCRATRGWAIRQRRAVSRASLTATATTTSHRPQSISTTAIITRSSRFPTATGTAATTMTTADGVIHGARTERPLWP
jgi:hypothetical protein